MDVVGFEGAGSALEILLLVSKVCEEWIEMGSRVYWSALFEALRDGICVCCIGEQGGSAEDGGEMHDKVKMRKSWEQV